MTADMPDAVNVAREAVFANADAIQRLVVNHTTAFTIALWGARAMQDAMAGRVRVKESDDVLRAELEARAASLLRKAGWKAGDKLHAIAQIGNMVEFGMSILLDPPAGCGYPNCGCDADAQCGSALEPAGAQEGAEDQPPSGAGLEDDIPPVEAMAIACGMLPPALNLHDAYAREKAAKDVHTEPTPAPAVPGLVVRLRQEAHETKISGPTWGDGSVMDEAADAIEALQAEVARKAGVIRAQDYDYGRACDERDEARARATAAEAERDALKEAAQAWIDAYPQGEEDNGEMELWARYGSEFAMAMRKTRAALSPAKAGG